MPELTGQTAGWLRPHAGRRPDRTAAAHRTFLRAASRAGKEDASPLPQGPPLGRDRRRVRGGGHPAPPRPGDRPARVAEALLQPGGDPDPPRPHRPGAPLLRSRRGSAAITTRRRGTRTAKRRRRYEQADSSGEPASLAEWTEFHEQVEALPEEEREVFNLSGTSR